MITIGVDVDDTVADLLGTWMQKLHALTGINVKPDQLRSWHIADHFPDEYRWAVDATLDQLDYAEVLPLPDTLAAIRKLRTIGRVVFVTSATSRLIMVQEKFKWLVRYGFIDKAEDFVVAKDKSLAKVDFLIDDGAHNIPTYKRGEPNGILLAKPHNRNDRAGRFVVKSLDEAYEAIKSFLEEDV